MKQLSYLFIQNCNEMKGIIVMQIDKVASVPREGESHVSNHGKESSK